jgi:tetratricopeptide (TPR) repeat protein
MMRLACLGLIVLLTGCGGPGAGHVHYAAGRHEAALQAWEGELQRAGGDAPAALHHNIAVAALRLGQLEKAEAAAARAREVGGSPYEALLAFVRGTLAFERSKAMEHEATRPGGDPKAMEMALMLAEDAQARWQHAATLRAADWPEARRNVERALLRLAALRESRRGGRADRPSQPQSTPGGDPQGNDGDPEDGPQPPKPPTKDGVDPSLPPDDTLNRRDLPRSKVLGLLDLLTEMDEEKQAGRRKARRERSTQVEKDW